MADQSTDFGKLLALGSAGAAAEIGKGEDYLQTVKGIELPMHDPRFGPGFARTYAVDPTPARHIKGGLGIQHMKTPDDSKYRVENTGQADLLATATQEIINTTGGGVLYQPNDAPTLASALKSLLLDKEKTAALGLRGRAAVQKKYALDTITKKMVKVYEKSLDLR